MNTSSGSEAIDNLNKQIELLQRRKEVIESILKEKQSLDEKITKVIEGKEIPEKPQDKPRKPKQIALPRGVLTLAAFETLRRANRPLHLREILEEVKNSPLIHDNVPSDLDRRLRGILQTSEQFKNVGASTFTNKSQTLEGKLFERLLASVVNNK